MEERTVKLTLDKAKEWYKKGGELKEVALQAYTEEELTKVELPKTWEEFLSIDTYTKTDKCGFQHIAYLSLLDRFIDTGRNKEYLAHLALMKLLFLRDYYRKGWKPEAYSKNYFAIEKLMPIEEVTIFNPRNIVKFLSFPTKEMAVEFFNNFKDLIEEAGDLL